MPAKISILIRTKNSEKNLIKILKKIYSQEIDKSFEVVIVDSGSTDDTLKIASLYSCKTVKIPHEEFTYPHAINVGTKYSEGEYIVFLSHDAFPADKRWLYHLTKHFSDPNVAGVFGRQIPLKCLNPIEEYSLLYETFPSDASNSGALFSNADGCIRKDVWEKYKFDQKKVSKKRGILLICEDQLWAKEVKQEGYKIIYEPQSVVYHSHKFSLKELIKGYSGGYFSSELSFTSSILSEKSFWKQITVYLKRQIKCFRYLVKNHYFKSIVLDLPLTIFFGVFWFYLGKRDREKEDKLNNSFKSNPGNSESLSN